MFDMRIDWSIAWLIEKSVETDNTEVVKLTDDGSRKDFAVDAKAHNEIINSMLEWSMIDGDDEPMEQMFENKDIRGCVKKIDFFFKFLCKVKCQKNSISCWAH